ncbi:acyltransferase family-domain-containing protein [Pseudomassariella vexata]|uniref:Acyltransferase family-domain-containing protein n=1 Tax=Pseudomassariella vexata TaxID=1141098 RepID=A0A1Y2DNF5_9PEZI|nr:acyltransferase family-domain-containing protein [Pseudomassariella vexata]ORY60823.1 acyltransferase family-domain-containing protein [Pseudomassariella vexata]
MAIGKEGNVKWVDGLRGLASTLVVLTHIARAFDGDLFLPASAEGAAPRILQLPFIRILVQGRIGVSIFSFVTGYVCALKPIKLYRQGNQEAAFNSISKSALRRVPRLVIPTALATCIIWVMAQLGFFLVAKRSDSWWSGATAPDRVPHLVDALKSLVYNCITTWTNGRNAYDGNQWTLMPLLRGSLWVYIFIVATAYLQPRYRMIASIGMFLYFYIAADSAFGMQFFWGVFLCDLQNHTPSTDFITNRPRISKMLATIFLVFGLYVASYPEGHHEWQRWSQWQHRVLVSITPNKADLPRFGSGIGLELITLGIHFSPFLKDVLSGKYLLWLGKQSFAVYLLHGPLLRWILCWMVYGTHMPQDFTNDHGEKVPGKLIFPGGYKLLIWLPIWIPLNYGVALLWTTYVDPWCATVTEQFVGYIKVDNTEKQGVLLPH